MKAGFWKTDWFFGLVVALVMLLLSNSDLLQSLERKAYDMGMTSSSRTPLGGTAVVANDDGSSASLGLWLWRSDIHAKVADLLTIAKAKAIGDTVFSHRAQIDPGNRYVWKLLGMSGRAAPIADNSTADPAFSHLPLVCIRCSVANSRSRAARWPS